MRSESQLRDGLTEFAETAQPSEHYEAQILQRARRIRSRRNTVSVAAAVACMAVLVSVFRLVGFGVTPQLTAVPPDGPFLGWAVAGDPANADLVRQASTAWDNTAQASPAPHTAVRAILVTRDPSLKAVVILQGYDHRGVPRLAFFTSDTSRGDALTLRADRPAPDPVRTQVVSLVSSRLSAAAGAVSDDPWGAFAIAVAAPGITKLQVASTTIDQVLRQGGGLDNGRFEVQELPISATAQSTSITGFLKGRQMFHTVADGGAIGDAQGVPARVLQRDQQSITVTLDDALAVRPGQLVVAPSGLVGRVAAVDTAATRATIALVTGTGFSSPVYTNISNVTGTARGTGTTLLVERIGTGVDNEVNRTNRVLAPDPAQRHDKAGAVTIGRASTDKAIDATTVELTPAVDVARLQEVTIMTPYAGSPA